MPRLVAIAALACSLNGLLACGASAAAIDFEKQVAPLLVRHCLECHNAREQKGGLDLTQRSTALAGGDSGAAVIPKKAIVPEKDEGLLLERVRAGEMPPPLKGEARPLAAAEIAVLSEWVRAGAPWPAERTLSLFERTSEVRAGLDWWSLQPVRRPLPPQLGDQRLHPIDAFVRQRLSDQQMTPAPRADRRTLIRRLHFDVLGLPPTPEAIDAFVRDDSPDAYERLVDRLLQSPHFGERMARRWLDLVRFAETCGYERDQLKPEIWRYRDWVIRALNEDLPFDRFVAEQLAGDEVPWRDEQTVIATGMLRAGTWNDEPNDAADYLYERLEDMVHVTSSALLGLTVKCARCHDHKFDPIRQTDYYRMAGFFWAGYTGQANLGGPSHEQLGYPVFGWTDRGREVPPIRLLEKGDRHRPGEQVPPGFLSAIASLDRPLAPPSADSTTTQRRLQLARWITDDRNPLTPRVLVNRIWQHYFGNALVRTPNNFGFKSDPPTHPQLLDWLAAELVAGDWKTKRIHKMVLMSQTYQQASQHAEQEPYSRRDFLNRLLWRQNRRRLDAEALRDTLLATSGQLNSQMGGPSFFPRMSAEALEGLSRKGNAWGSSPPSERSRRTIYMMTKRSRLLPLMTTFDFSDTTLPCGRRDVTTVAPQALALLNNHFVHEQSERMAVRVRSEAGEQPDQQIRRAWQLALGRLPLASEKATARKHLLHQESHFAAQQAAASGATLNGKAASETTELPVKNDLELWLRADKGTTLDSQGRLVAWSDQSEPARRDAHRHDASQAAAKHRPLPVADALNGHPVIRFDGEARYLHVAGQLLWTPQFSIFAVVNDRADGAGPREVISNWHRNGNSTSSIFLGLTGAGQVRLSDNFADAGTLEQPAQHTVLTAINGADASTFQNRRLIASRPQPLANRTLRSPYVIGTQGNIDGEYWKGDLAELLVYDRALDPQERDQVWSYLMTRYGLGEPPPPRDPRQLALASLCHVLMNTNEFIYVD